jgi:hypothetical protein
MSDDAKHQRIVKLRADWGTGPLWVSTGDDFPDPYDADEITEVVSLSDSLRAAIAVWDERFQGTYNDSLPQNSGIRDPVERAAFITDGQKLAQRIKDEVPAGTVVRYEDVDGRQLTIERE